MTLQEKADKLLKKKKITGHDVGALLLESFRVVVEEKEEQIDADTFSHLEAKVYADKKEAQIYSLYRDIYFQFTQAYKKTFGMMEQFTTSFTPEKTLNEFIEREKNFFSIERTIPVIVSREEYKAILDDAKTNIKAHPAIAYYALIEYTRAWQNRAELDPKIRNAVKKYKKMSPALNKRFGAAFLKPIYKINGKEFYTIQDPAFIEAKKARALELTGKEDLTEYDEYIADKKKELLYKGPAAIRDYMRKATGKALLHLDDEQLSYGVELSLRRPPEDFYAAPDYLEIENALNLNPVVEYCGQKENEYREGRTYFDLIALYTAGPISDDLPEMIKKDYPALATAFDNFLETEAENDFSTLPAYLVTLLSWRYNDKPQILERINTGGLAVNIDPVQQKKGKENIFVKMNLPRAGKKEEKSLKVFEPLAYMNCFNITVDLLAEVFDVPELKDYAKFTLPGWPEYSERFNGVLYRTYYYLADNYSGSELQQKRQALKDIFPFGYLRSISDFLPDKKKVNEVKADLIELRDTNDPAGRLRIFETITIRRLLQIINLDFA